jgi:hypothetical protein
VRSNFFAKRSNFSVDLAEIICQELAILIEIDRDHIDIIC